MPASWLRESEKMETTNQAEAIEQALLGALLLNNNAMERIESGLTPEHFFIPVHGRIYAAIEILMGKGTVANPLTLQPFFEQDDALADVGGPAYLAGLVASATSIITVPDYARSVVDGYTRRELAEIGEIITYEAFNYEPGTSAIDKLEEAEKLLFDLAELGSQDRGFETISDASLRAIETINNAYKGGGGITGVRSYLIDLDQMMGGFQPSDLIILAARPAMGKTALATNIAVSASASKENPKHVALFSLEMASDQLANRVIADIAGVASDLLRRGKVSAKEVERAVKASQGLKDVPLMLDDTPALSVSAIRTRARRLKRQKGLDLVIVDYLQLMKGTGRSDNRVQEVTEISQGLKAMAKELDVPVIALSQLSRAVEQREDKRPLLSDLRESGSIEQDADVVMFLYREEYYLSKAAPERRANETQVAFSERLENWEKAISEKSGVAELIIAKQRHGPVGTVNLHFNPETTKFESLSQRENGETDGYL